MIKIIITTSFLFGTSLIYAQQKDAPRSSREQVISTENPHNPLVNGIPYDQYKAQVKAEEKQRAAKEAEAKKLDERRIKSGSQNQSATKSSAK